LVRRQGTLLEAGGQTIGLRRRNVLVDVEPRLSADAAITPGG